MVYEFSRVYVEDQCILSISRFPNRTLPCSVLKLSFGNTRGFLAWKFFRKKKTKECKSLRPMMCEYVIEVDHARNESYFDLRPA